MDRGGRLGWFTPQRFTFDLQKCSFELSRSWCAGSISKANQSEAVFAGSCAIFGERAQGQLMMNPTEPVDFVDVASEEIERLSLVQKDKITAGEVARGPKMSVSHTKGTLQFKLLFGGGSHWTMIYDLDERPIGCEFHKVRFRRCGDQIFVFGGDQP